MKQAILQRLLAKSPDVAYLANLDDLGSEEELNSALRQLKQEGLVNYDCAQGCGWGDYGDDIDIAKIELTIAGRNYVAIPCSEYQSTLNSSQSTSSLS